VDLRNDEEIEAQPSVFCESSTVGYCWRPFWGEPLAEGAMPDLRHGYIRELDLCGSRLAGICGELAQSGMFPALVHCAAGKDRTGVLVALLLATAGVRPGLIVDDYALSRASLGDEFLEESRQWVPGRGARWEDYADLYDAPPERMERTLEHLETRWGGAVRYLLEHGLAREDVERLRVALIEPAA
jgi:protein-tyrosine phosphatase